jgi:hypothetical protein
MNALQGWLSILIKLLVFGPATVAGAYVFGRQRALALTQLLERVIKGLQDENAVQAATLARQAESIERLEAGGAA